jgi:cytochrome c oxidase subunit II
MKKPSWRLRTAAIATVVCAAAVPLYLMAAASNVQEPASRITIDARKFEFGPKQIQVKKGQRVTIVLTSPDFVHGFALPDFNVRADGIPGKTVEITFVADKAGKFIYLCDNFCGEDHDRMSGFLVVTER